MDEIAREHPSRFDNSTLPITPVEQLHLTGRPPKHVDINAYRLTIDGLVENPISLTYQDILRYPSWTEVVLLICPTVFADNAEWTGVPLSTLLSEVGVKSNAQELRFSAIDGYTTTLSLEHAMEEGVFLAYEVNGKILPVAHGYPLRVVVRGQYGFEWVKWLTRIEVS
jgi:DMSO/TMAO reductase YedYZ molybdopterin-dependent catalytic subunit